MTRLWWFLLLPALLWASLGVAPARATSCRCPARSVVHARKAAVAVFEGQVREVAAAEAGQTRVRFAVVRSWKGVASETVTVWRRDSRCATRFEVGTSYLVYAVTDSAGQLRVELCSRTRPMSRAAPDLEVLGMGATPFDPQPLPSDAADREAPARGGCASCAVVGPAGAPWGLWGVAWLVLLGRRRLARH